MNVQSWVQKVYFKSCSAESQTSHVVSVFLILISIQTNINYPTFCNCLSSCSCSFAEKMHCFSEKVHMVGIRKYWKS